MLFTVSAVQPYDIWRDSIWQFLGVVVALIIGIPGLFISIRGLLQQRNLKRLDYEIINDTPILDVQQDSKVKIEVNDKQVRNLRLVFLKIRNTGNVPIKEEDFVEPLAFKFRSGAEVLDSKIEEVIPSNLKPSLTVDSQSVTLKPLLLNPKDTIKLKMLLSGSNEKIEGEVRIAGIHKLEKRLGTKYVIVCTGIVLVLTLIFVPLMHFLGFLGLIIGLAVTLLLTIIAGIILRLFFRILGERINYLE